MIISDVSVENAKEIIVWHINLASMFIALMELNYETPDIFSNGKSYLFVSFRYTMYM